VQEFSYRGMSVASVRRGQLMRPYRVFEDRRPVIGCYDPSILKMQEQGLEQGQGCGAGVVIIWVHLQVSPSKRI
jgi:hypothetical protein